MPLPLLWLVGTVAAGVAGYAVKKMTEKDDSSSRGDDDSSYEEERRRQNKAKREARKEEKAKRMEILEIDFASTGEKYRHDITSALKDLVILHFEKNPGFCCTLGSLQAGSDQQIKWTNNHCTPKIQTNLLFLVKNYAVEIYPGTQFKKLSEKIDESRSAMNDLKHKKLALKKMKYQLKKAAK